MPEDSDPRSALAHLLDADPYDLIEQPPPAGPAPCPMCGGRGAIGGPDEFGNVDPCDICDSTGIDPADPASPL